MNALFPVIIPMYPISIAITTHNRINDLSKTLQALEPFDGSFAELAICADGCTDGTQEFLKQKYPDIRVIENNPGKGSIPSRNRLIEMAKAPFVLLLDDDSYPVESNFLEVVTEVMAQNPKIGVLTFPQRSDEFPESLQCENFGPNLRVGTFTSSGSVIRRELFIELGGFPEMFFHAYEEPDFSVRVYDAGYCVAQWNELTVRHHFTTAMRDEGRTHRRHARNELWSTVLRAPWRYLIPVVFYRIGSQMGYAIKRGFRWVLREPQWWWAALQQIGNAFRQREPVSVVAYRRWISLVRNPEQLDVEEVE